MKTILLIGLGRFGRHAARKLQELGHEVMAVDKDEERVNDALSFVTNAQIGDSTRRDFLASLGIPEYDLCIVSISGDFQSSLETTSLLKELGARYVVSRGERDIQAKFLLRNGADEVVYPEKQAAIWTAIRYSSDYILDYIELDGTYSIFEVTVPENWEGRTVKELDIRRKYEIQILATRQNGRLDMVVRPDTVLRPGMTLLVLGEYKALQKCFRV